MLVAQYFNPRILVCTEFSYDYIWHTWRHTLHRVRVPILCVPLSRGVLMTSVLVVVLQTLLLSTFAGTATAGTVNFYRGISQFSMQEPCTARSYLGRSNDMVNWYEVVGTRCAWRRPSCTVTCRIECGAHSSSSGSCIECSSVSCSGQNVCTLVDYVNRGGGGCTTLDQAPCNQDFTLFCPGLANLERYCQELGWSLCPSGMLGVNVTCSSQQRTP